MSTKIRDEIPESPTLPLPQTGWHRAEVYAAAMEMTWRAFRDNVTKNHIPHRMFGDTMLVLAEEFYAALPILGGSPDAPSKRKRSR